MKCKSLFGIPVSEGSSSFLRARGKARNNREELKKKV
jgi:hypothetical protein